MTRRRAVRVALGLLLGTSAYIVPFGAVAGVLLPARIAEIDPTHKVPLVVALGVGTASAGLIGNVLFGALSDRTLVRWRGRLPWLTGGAVGGALLMLPVAFSTDVVELMAWWFLAVGALNATTVSVLAFLPDRVPRARRATLAGVVGVGALLGVAVGTAIGAALLASFSAGVMAVAALAVILAAGATLALAGPPIDPGPTDTALPPAAPTAIDAVVPGRGPPVPRVAPDFSRAFAARLLLVLAYFMTHAFGLFVLTDYVGLDTAAAAHALALTSIVFLASSVTGALITGVASDRRGRRKPTAIGCALVFLVASTIPVLTPTLAGMIAFSAIGGIAVGGFSAVDVALMSEVLPSAGSRGRDLGILNVASTSGQMLGPAAGSALLGLGQGYAAVFAGAAAACALGIPFLASIRSVR